MLRLAAITDEFAPDLETALPAMKDCGMTGAELRTIHGRNIVDLSDAELETVGATLHANGFEVVSIASPLLKCILPGAPEIDSRFQHDVFASAHTFADQPRIAQRTIAVAQTLGARIIRVFSYWRTIQPPKCFDAVVAALSSLAQDAAKYGLIIGLENEHACNVGTASEAAAVLDAVRHPNLKLIWDPANALVAGEPPFPLGYAKLPKDRLVHVHAKDWHSGWCALGEGEIDWKGQLAALNADGYTGWISLETHWAGPNGNKLEASRICGHTLRALLDA
ncbi:MAG: sugar phosphate isomerase/epimerase family protein [Bryobacteraceae bacterium]|jgi:sugar phosphate isomerase/epimerase